MNRLAAIFSSLVTLLALTSPSAAAEDAAAATNSLDKRAFEIIVRNNIFDPSRVGARAPRPRAPRVESFAFCGGAFDGPIAVAFFSGFGAPSKPVVPGDTINGFKVGAITFRSVELKPADGAPLTLALGMNMRREENGPWKASDQPAVAETPVAAPGATNAPATAASAAESDIIKRLRAKREEN